MFRQRLGPYAIEERLASGGMAEVFLAKREGPHGFEKRVALKRILPQLAKDPDFVSMFIDEARLAARLEHPNIVQVFDFGEYDDELCLAMELVVGTTVGRLLRAAQVRREQISLEDALYIAAQAAHALEYAHRARDDRGAPLGVVHRDVSPANLLLTHTGHVKLSDFGIARAATKVAVTDGGHVRGKMGYMSPEQVLARDLDAKSDVFTLSAVFAELLLGAPLFGDGTDIDVLIRIRDVDLEPILSSERRIPKDVLHVLKLGLNKGAKDRPSAGSFAQALDEIMHRRGIRGQATRLARLIQRFHIVKGSRSDEEAYEAGAKHTALVGATGEVKMTGETADLRKGASVESPKIYRVRLDNGSVVGPLPFPKVVQMITSGEVGGGHSVAKHDNSFHPIATLREFQRFVTSPVFKWDEKEISGATRTGAITGANLLPLVHELTVTHQTGVLHLVNGSKKKKIYFVDGRPDYVASTDRSELLGEYLITEGKCLRMEVDMALALMPKYEGRLGDALVGMGVLKPMGLFKVVADQAKARYLEAFRWNSGTWAWVPGVRCGEETIPLSQDTEELLLEAACEPDMNSLREHLVPFAPKRISLNPDPGVPLRAFRMPQEWLNFLKVDHPTPLGQLIDRASHESELSEEEVHRAVYLGLSCGLLRVEESRPPK